MADELPPIRARLTLDDSQVAEVMDQVGKTSHTMGRSMAAGAETGRLGMWSLGESAENLAQSMGVPHQMSRQLGNSVERLMGGMGKLAVGFGVASLAAMAAYAVWTKVNEEKKKAHEELEKNVDALLKEESALSKNMLSTQGLREANERLRDVKRGILDQKFGEWIKQEADEIARLKNELADGGPWGAIWKWIKDVKELEDMDAEEKKRRAVEVNNLINEKEAELARKREERKTQRLNEIVILNDAEKAQYYDYQTIINKSIDDDARRAEKAEQQAQREMQARQAVAQNFANAFQMMSTLGGKHARQFFTLYKLAAISETIISTMVAAQHAMAWGTKTGSPILGAIWATSTILAGMARVAVIRSQEFNGGGGGGGGAVGTFSANPATGLPAGNGTGSVNLTVFINGQATNIGEITAGVVNELYRNNGSVGGFTVAVERSA